MNTLQNVVIKTKKILLIDEEASVREIVALCLKDIAGWKVVTTNSSCTALQRAEIDRPDAIVLDLSIRGSFMFLQQLKNNRATQAIPVVLLSAGARWLDSEFLQQYQIAGVILKPFNPVTLPIQIDTLLGWDSLRITDFTSAT